MSLRLAKFVLVLVAGLTVLAFFVVWLGAQHAIAVNDALTKDRIRWATARLEFRKRVAKVGPIKVKVRTVHGTAEYSQGAQWMPLRPNTDLWAGAQIRTGPDAYVSVNVNWLPASVRITEYTTIPADRIRVAFCDDKLLTVER